MATLVSTFPDRLGREVTVRLMATPGGAEREPGELRLILPSWLEDRYPPSGPAAGGLPEVADLIWGQECVVWAVRLRDDLLDGQVEGQATGGAWELAAELLQLEAERALAETWGELACRRYRQVLQTTMRAILRVRELQRRPQGMPVDSLDLYARVNEVFKLASAVLLESLGRSSELSAVGAFCDHLGVAGQIVDDLEDVEEDLAEGRLNWAASRLVEAGVTESTDPLRLIGTALVRGRTSDRILREVRDRLDLAARAIAPLELTESARYIADLRGQVDSLESRLHRARVLGSLGLG